MKKKFRCVVRRMLFSTLLVGVLALTGTFGCERRKNGPTTSPIAAATRPTNPNAQMRRFTNSIGMDFVRIEPGKFVMGSPLSEASRVDNEVQHTVTLTRPFFMQTTAVTQAQWIAVMETNPSHFKGDTLPVEQVLWGDAVAFCKKLSQMEHKPEGTYRLPTEAEWEYACRTGTTTPFYTGETISTLQANFNGEVVYGTGVKGVFRDKTTPVGDV